MLHPRALAAADPLPLARAIAELAEVEGADTLVYDDESGIYGHPDHSAVHLIGTTAAGLTGAAGYRTTVAHDLLHAVAPDGHLVYGAARAADVSFGRPSAQIELSVTGSARDLEAKYRAITAHASQISAQDVPRDEFVAAYGTEWFLREGKPGALDELADRDRGLLGAAV
jgi:LmbE family N-acetylglucosaminyl deacetylase